MSICTPRHLLRLPHWLPLILCGCGGRVDIASDGVRADRATLAAEAGDQQALADPQIGSEAFDPRVACERSCGYPEECGVEATAVPEFGNGCFGPGCPPALDCVSDCVQRFSWYEQLGSECMRAARDSYACLQSVGCGPLNEANGELWFDSSQCDGVDVPADLDQACFGASDTCLLGPSGGTIDPASQPPPLPVPPAMQSPPVAFRASCGASLLCDATGTFIVRCQQVAESSALFACECERDGIVERSVEVEGACEVLPGASQAFALQDYFTQSCGWTFGD